MKKILFLMRHPLEDAYNLKFKFMGQMRACVNLGYDVSFIGYDAEKYYLCSVNSGSRKVIGKTHFHKYKKYRNTFAFFDMYSALADVLNTDSFDYIYMRSKPVTRKATSSLKKHKAKGGKLIVEIPTFGVNEASLSFARRLVNRFFAKSEKNFEQMIDRYTLIGENCPKIYKGKTAIEIANGVSIETIPMKKQIELGGEIHMIALASMREWQGFDRIINGMSQFSGVERLVLHLVGQDFDGSVQKWLKMAEGLNVIDNVIYHGAMYDEQLTNLFDNCHIAIGAMALHRRGNVVGSPLKVREYLARGIPFIYSYVDSALSGEEWFALKIQEDDSAVDFNIVVPWIKSIYTNSQAISEIRKFASENLSWETQLKSVFLNAEKV